MEKLKQQLNKTGLTSAVLIDLSKAFDAINFDLLIAKLYALGFGKDPLDLVYC